MHRTIFLWAAVSGILAVAIGAFSAHALKKYLGPEDMAVFKTGVEYHFYHTMALFIAGILYKHYHNSLFSIAALCFGTGILFFSGSLYALKLTKLSSTGEERWLGSLTPFGGIMFIAGWVLIAIYFLKSRK